MTNPFYRSLPYEVEKLRAEKEHLLFVLKEIGSELNSSSPNLTSIKMAADTALAVHQYIQKKEDPNQTVLNY
jgi:hypothetical protein